MANCRYVLFSQVHENGHQLPPLKDLLSKAGMDVRDGSVHSDRPDNAKSPKHIRSEVLTSRIRWASVLVVFISHENKDCEWVAREFEYAERRGKRIVGVWNHGEAQCDIPPSLHQDSDAMVGWQGERVKVAIEGRIVHCEQSDASETGPRSVSCYF